MRILILADASFATRERAMLSRLEVGLVDEGLRVVHGVPSSVAADSPQEVQSQRLVYEDRGFVVSRSWRARRLYDGLEALRGTEDERAADVIHAFGEAGWAIASEVARLSGAALALEVWRRGLVETAAALRTPSRSGPATIFLCPDPSIERALRDRAPGVQARVAPWGVHAPQAPREILAPGRAVSVMIAGGGRDAAALGAALHGLASVVERRDDVVVFADSDAVRDAGAWPVIKRLGLVDRLTLLPELESRRELALCADILLVPESLGEHRTIVLDAMAAGMAIVAAADPGVSCLIPGRTARIVDRPSGGPWGAALSSLLDEPESARSLALSARDYVREQHKVSAQVAAVVDAYEWMASDHAIPFRAPST